MPGSTIQRREPCDRGADAGDEHRHQQGHGHDVAEMAM